jgi:hypothetical protein
MQATRCADSLARNPCRVIRGEKNQYRSNFLRPAESRTERSSGCYCISVRATDKANSTIALGVNQARSDGINPDIPRPQLLRECHGDRVYRALGRGVTSHFISDALLLSILLQRVKLRLRAVDARPPIPGCGADARVSETRGSPSRRTAQDEIEPTAAAIRGATSRNRSV